MDEARLAKVLARIGDVAKYPTSLPSEDIPDNLVLPMLTLEEFFEGNDDAGSIGCNLDSQPEPAEICKFLEEIRQRPDVANVYVMVTQYDGPGNWPFSDTVWIITSASEDEVFAWIPDEYQPDEVSAGFSEHYICEKPDIPKGMQPISLWYD